MLHLINNVIVPSDKSVVNLISAAPNMRIISKLLEVTGYADQLGLQTKEEEAYERSTSLMLVKSAHSKMRVATILTKARD